MITQIISCDVCGEKCQKYIKLILTLINRYLPGTINPELKEIHICYDCQKEKSISSLLTNIEKDYKVIKL